MWSLGQLLEAPETHSQSGTKVVFDHQALLSGSTSVMIHLLPTTPVSV